jgi:hypothetical protein
VIIHFLTSIKMLVSAGLNSAHRSPTAPSGQPGANSRGSGAGRRPPLEDGGHGADDVDLDPVSVFGVGVTFLVGGLEGFTPGLAAVAVGVGLATRWPAPVRQALDVLLEVLLSSL